MDEPQFEFQKLEVYQRAMELKFLVERIIQQLPTGTADLRNQLRRSDRSVRLNTAEGAGKHRPGGEVERFRTARGSANECAAALDEVRHLGLADRELTLEALRLVHRIIAMLSKLIIRWENA